MADKKTVSWDIGDLAYALWKVRDEALKGTRFEDARGAIPRPEEAALYRELAAYVLEKYELKEAKAKPKAKPLRIEDNDGDFWHLNANGTYRLLYQSGRWSEVFNNETYEEIIADHGIKSEVFA